MTNDSKTARDVIVDALTARHEELSGEASPLDYDGARQVLRALEASGFVVVSHADVSARVIREHEPRPMGCACGAQMGDSIDYRWHLVNQTLLAAGRDPRG